MHSYFSIVLLCTCVALVTAQAVHASDHGRLTSKSLAASSPLLKRGGTLAFEMSESFSEGQDGAWYTTSMLLDV